MIIRSQGKPRPESAGRGFSAARKHATEKKLAEYTQLECGHYLTREARDIYAVFGSAVKDVFCEYCDAFYTIPKVERHASYPVNPLF